VLGKLKTGVGFFIIPDRLCIIAPLTVKRSSIIIYAEVNMPQIVIAVPDELLVSMNMKANEVALSMCKEYAVNLFLQGKLTLVQGAKFCGMNIYDFMTAVSEAGGPVIDYPVEEFDRELARLNL
jgi:predicted HTH domain antitoxin